MNKIFFNSNDWAEQSAQIVFETIENCLPLQDKCSVMLTGGRSAAKMYGFLAGLLASAKTPVEFFLGDERCVSADHPDSNFRMIMDRLFPSGTGIHSVHQMYHESLGIDGSLSLYERLLTDRVDILLLGLGDDGHIASLFPGQETLSVRGRKILTSVSPYNQMERISVSADVINHAGIIIVLASGKTKADVADRVETSSDFISLPAVLAKRGIWLLDN